jgi:hypothetical protein
MTYRSPLHSAAFEAIHRSPTSGSVIQCSPIHWPFANFGGTCSFVLRSRTPVRHYRPCGHSEKRETRCPGNRNLSALRILVSESAPPPPYCVGREGLESRLRTLIRNRRKIFSVTLLEITVQLVRANRMTSLRSVACSSVQAKSI